MPTASETSLRALNAMVGTWTTEATHPAFPGVIVRGTASVEWLEGERFLIHRARTDHSDFPDSVSIIGFTNEDRIGRSGAPDETRAAASPLTMHYFDSRGVFRVYEVSVDFGSLRYFRDSPGFSQRFSGTFTEDGNTLAGVWELNRDGAEWKDDLRITYRKR